MVNNNPSEKLRIGTCLGKLRIPVSMSDDGIYRYGLGHCMQVSPTQVALFLNIRRELVCGHDFEVGSDVLVFDSFNDICESAAVPFSRNGLETHPETGESMRKISGPVRCGFIPNGASQRNGLCHPHAGSGFGISRECTLPENKVNEVWDPIIVSQKYGRQYYKIYDLRFENNKLVTTNVSQLNEDELLDGWVISGLGISDPILDGDDLLLPGNATRAQRRTAYSEQRPGVMRWTCRNDKWRPVSFLPIGPIGWTEPTLVRSRNGDLLFTSRSYMDRLRHVIDVWRGDQHATKFELSLSQWAFRNESPISINQAADGSIYIASCMAVPYNGKGGWNGYQAYEENWQKHARCKLGIWPVNDNGDSLGEPITVCDFQDEKKHPLPSKEGYWRLDHPIGANIRLSDGKWHSVLCHRIMCRANSGHSGHPMPETGTYIWEIQTPYEAIAVWQFQTSQL